MISRRALLAGGLALLATPARAGDLVAVEPHAVSFAFQDREGRDVAANAFAGKPVLVHFWASWCGSCRVEFPELDAFRRDIAAHGIDVAAVSLDRLGWPAIDATTTALGIRDLAIFHDRNRDAARALGIVGLPTTLLVDAKSREIGRIVGSGAWGEAAFRDRLVALLRANA